MKVVKSVQSVQTSQTGQWHPPIGGCPAAHQPERERIHLLLIDEASKGLDDVAAGRVQDACTALTAIKKRRVA
jgi:hypothetical protein